MFRVLSDEEAKDVIRWKAPELSGSAGRVAATRPEVLTRLSRVDMPRQQAGAGLNRQQPVLQDVTSAPALQSAMSMSRAAEVARSMGTATAAQPDTRPVGSATTSAFPMAHPSADMLQSSYDEGYARGYDEGARNCATDGYSKGREEGHAAGFAEGNAALHLQSIAQLQTVIAELSNTASAVLDPSVEEEVLQMSIDIARLVIHAELQTSPELMVGLVQAGLSQLAEQTSVQHRVRLHPLDARIVRQAISGSELEIIDDASLAQGACRVESNASTVHAGVSDWLDQAAAQLGLPPAHSETAAF
jgi:flagellar assembly protein FliH